jgi:hypothetical protein
MPYDGISSFFGSEGMVLIAIFYANRLSEREGKVGGNPSTIDFSREGWRSKADGGTFKEIDLRLCASPPQMAEAVRGFRHFQDIPLEV